MYNLNYDGNALRRSEDNPTINNDAVLTIILKFIWFKSVKSMGSSSTYQSLFTGNNAQVLNRFRINNKNLTKMI